MSLDLSQLRFQVDTSELDRAGKAIGELVVNVSKLDKATKDAARTEATLAKAAKDNAAANLSNAKAQQVNAKAVENTEKAQKSTAAAIEKSTTILERQKDILEFQTQGFSKGQSSILAYGKAAGLAAADINELGKVLETQRKLMGSDPFDKSLSGIKSLQNQYTELKESIRQYATDSNLSAKQTRELARDKERLIEKMKVEGASFSEIRTAVRAHNEEYVRLAASYNKTIFAEGAVIKGRKDAVNATNYLTQADQKMAAALNMSNSSLDKAGTDSLVRYESALRKSGLAQDVVTQKLSTYKVQLAQVQAQEAKRSEQHLARALPAQFTDIGVSLYSGQNPLTVLLQQSGQILDIFQLSGVAADKFAEATKRAFYSMVPAMATVAKGLAGLVGGLFMDAGSAVSRFVGNITGISAAMEIAKRAIVSGGEENFKYVASLEKISKAAAATAAGGIAALILVVALLALEYKKIIQAESDLSKALATSGGALGITRDQAVAAAEGMSSLGIGTLKAMSAFTEIAKAGNIGKSSLELVTKAAVELEKTAGVSIEETAKQYAKLQEEPSKALIEIAQKTGLVDRETLAYVSSLEQQGNLTEAARVATLALASAHSQVASEIKDNWSPVEVLWHDIKTAIGAVQQEIYDLATSNAAVGAMRTVWETVAVVISEVWFTIKGVGKEIGGVAAQIAAVMSGPGGFARAASIGEQMKADAESAAAAQKKFVASILDRSAVEQKSFNQNKEQNSQYAKWRKENEQALVSAISKEDKYKAKQLEVQKAVLAGTVNQIEADKALAGWKKIIYGDAKPKKDSSENYYATLMREATNNTIAADTATQGLTKSELKLLEIKSDPRFSKLNATQKSDVTAKYESAIASEKQVKAEKDLADAEEFRLKLLGKSDGFGKQYYADMLKLSEYAKVAGWSAEQVEQLTAAIYKGTPAWKAHEKALEAVNTAATKFREDSIATQAAVTKENESLDYRISLLGQTTEEQRILAIEYTRSNKLREVDVKLAKELREIEEKIAKAKKSGLPSNEYQSLIDAQIQAEKDAAGQRKVINREVAVQYAEDLDKEFRAIKDGITESIVTALFDGGKEGSKKLRELLVNTLRKKVTIVVDAVVNTLVGSVVGSLFGSSSSTTGSGSGGLSSVSNLASLSNLPSTISKLTSSVSSLWAGLTASGATASGAASAGLAYSSSVAAGSGGSFLAGSSLASMSGLGLAGIAAIGAVIAKSLFGSKKVSSSSLGGTESSYDAAGNRTSYNPYYDTRAGTTAGADSIVQSMQDTYISTAKALGITTAATTFAYAANTGKNGANPNFSLTGSAGGSGYSQSWTSISDDAVQLAASRAVLAALKGSTLPKYLSGVFDDISVSTATQDAIDTALTYAKSLTALHTALAALPFNKLADASYDTMQAILELTGGVDALSNSLTSYYQNYYSETERLTVSTAGLSKVFDDLGITMPTSKSAFRDLIESLDLTTTSGQSTYAALLGVESAFASVADAVTTMTQSVLDEAKRIRGVIAGGSSNSYAAAQASFAVNTAQARAGDSTALAALPEISQLLLSLAESSASTSVELARVRALTASSLETTAATVASKYGIKLPSYDVGTNYVPKDMIAQIHEGEAIVPRAYNPDAGNTSSSNDSSNTEVVAALKSLRDDVNAALRAIAANTSKSTKLLQRVTQDGEAMQTVPAT